MATMNVEIKVKVTNLMVAIIDKDSYPRIDYFTLYGTYGKRDAQKVIEEKYGDTIKSVTIMSIKKEQIKKYVSVDLVSELFGDDRKSFNEQNNELKEYFENNPLPDIDK